MFYNFEYFYITNVLDTKTPDIFSYIVDVNHII